MYYLPPMHVVVAYLDPGTGSMLVQVILGGVAGVAVTMKMFGRRMLAALRLRKPVAEERQSADSDSA